MPETMDALLAEKTKRDYVCSNCYSSLYLVAAEDGKFAVKCAKCGDDTVGYVTRVYADRAKSQSIADLYDARDTLKKVGIETNPQSGKSREQLLKELGF